MTDRELLQQALIAIDDILQEAYDDCGVPNCNECKLFRHAWDVERMIRERLAQPEQEEMRQTPEMIARAIKAAPPAQKPLTNAQIDAIVDWPDFVKASMMSGIHLTNNIIAVVRVVEAAHGIKGE